MRSLTQHLLQHPVLACAQGLESALAEVAHIDPVFMTTDDKADAHVVLARVTSRLEALKLRLTAASADVADDTADRDVASWLGRVTRVDRQAARRHERLATALDRRWHGLAQALTTAQVNTDQAHVISRALDDLARALDQFDLDADQVRGSLAHAETHLVEQAQTFGPADLQRLGAKILEVVAPEVAEEALRRRMEADERRAARLTSLTTRRLGDGTTQIKARVPDSIAQRLTAYLQAYTNPRKQADPAASPAPSSTTDAAAFEKTPYDLRLGRAFCQLLETMDPRRLPLHGGDATTLVVTIDLTALLSGIGAATLPDGQSISAGDARRLACTADLVPAVLGTGSHVLDLGLSARLFSPGQRKALALRDRHCRAEGCDIPATWCEAHHLTPWSQRGPTDLDNGVLLCSHHHHRIHDDRYLHDRHANGDIRFTRRR